MISPFKPITREEAAEILSVSLSTLDNMIASRAMPAPVSLNGSRRKYWHPELFYGWLDRELRQDASKTGELQEASFRGNPSKPLGRKSAPAMGIAERARARNAARIGKLNEEGA